MYCVILDYVGRHDNACYPIVYNGGHELTTARETMRKVIRKYNTDIPQKSFDACIDLGHCVFRVDMPWALDKYLLSVYIREVQDEVRKED